MSKRMRWSITGFVVIVLMSAGALYALRAKDAAPEIARQAAAAPEAVPPKVETAEIAPAESAPQEQAAVPQAEASPAAAPAATERTTRQGRGRIFGKAVAPAEGRGLPITVALHLVDSKSPEVSYEDNLVGKAEAAAADGTFEFTGLPMGEYVLLASATGYTINGAARLEAKRIEREVTLTLVPGGNIAGRVVNQNQEPVAGAHVFVGGWNIQGQSAEAPRDRSLASQRVTDAAGAFTIENLRKSLNNEPGYKLAVKAEGYATLVSDYLQAGAQGVTLTVKPGGVVSGRLIADATGEAIPDKTVSIDSAVSVEQLTGRTDAEGFFFVTDVPPGTQTASLRDEELVITPDSAKIQIADGAPTDDVELRASTGGKVSGRVYNSETGESIASVKLYAYATGSQEERSKEILTNSEGTSQQTAAPLDAISATATPTPLEAASDLGQTQGSDPAKVAILEGQVVDKLTGKPIPVFRIRATGVSDASPKTDLRGNYFRISDPQGRFRLKVATTRISVRAAGYADTVVPFAALARGETRGGLLVRLEPGVELEGRVIDDLGRPVAMADIRVEGEDEEWQRNERRRDRSNDDGTFYLSALPSGAINLRVWEQRFAPKTVSVNVSTGGDNTVTVALEPYVGSTVDGIVTLNGEPAAGQSVTLYSGALPGRLPPHVMTDEHGRYHISGATEDHAGLFAEVLLPDGAATSKHLSLELVEGGAATKDIELITGTGVVEGKVYPLPESPSGQPLWISASFMRGEHLEQQNTDAQADSSGNFTIGHLPPGNIRLSFFVKGMQHTKIVTFELADGEHAHHDLRLSGGPTVRATISWDGPGDWSGSVWAVKGADDFRHSTRRELLTTYKWRGDGFAWATNAGTAEISALDPGTYTIVAFAEEGQSGGRTPGTLTGSTVVEIGPDEVVEISLSLE